MRRRFALTTTIATAAIVTLFAAAAVAHVSVTPKQAAKGSTATLTFRVPNEKDDASTTKVEIFLPDDHPMTTLTAQPVAGWTEATSGTVSASWTADAGAGIRPDSAQTFTITVGPLPSDADSLVFKALQTYSDGEVVRWIETTPPGGAEPDFPAPTLALTGPIVATTTTSARPSTTVAASTRTTVTPTTSSATDGSNDDGGNGALVVVIIVVVLLFAAVAYATARGRRGRA